MSILVRIWS